ncbi:fumarylacetoacetate hydrolase family protein [Burkholderia orbicola]|uniref:fumarylacetoacetate hydrolase family protein n=1 Tax=Burkholderia orbicola TaxID=2978683 RepID=UPI0039A6C7DD
MTAQQRAAFGRIEGDMITPLLKHDDLSGQDPLRYLLARRVDLATVAPVGDPIKLDACTLLSPVLAPSKILAIGLNYVPHAAEVEFEPPAKPLLFSKYPSSIIGPDAAISFNTKDTSQVDYEAEMGVIIGRTARNVAEHDALDYVFGYTACNDVSARDAQFSDGQWVRGKSFDTFFPLGPWIVTADEIPDPQALAISCHVNGQELQSANTREMIFGVAELISYFSRMITLEPGDVIASGTPAGVGFARKPQIFLRNGDVVTVEIERIGKLTNPVVSVD